MKRKEVEGREDNPFTRRKCNPRMVTKSNTGAVVDPEMLKELVERWVGKNLRKVWDWDWLISRHLPTFTGIELRRRTSWPLPRPPLRRGRKTPWRPRQRTAAERPREAAAEAAAP